jgi:hypothetical protein
MTIDAGYRRGALLRAEESILARTRATDFSRHEKPLSVSSVRRLSVAAIACRVWARARISFSTAGSPPSASTCFPSAQMLSDRRDNRNNYWHRRNSHVNNGCQKQIVAAWCLTMGIIGS